MKTRHDLERELLGEYVAECTTLDASRLAKAQALVEGGQVLPTDAEDMFHVGNQQRTSYYAVTTTSCTCTDWEHGHLRSEEFICKHVGALRLWLKVQHRLMKVQQEGVCHRHLFLCGHSKGHIICYASPCPDPPEVLCPICAAGEAETPAEAPEGYEMRDGTVLTAEDLTREYPEMAQHAPEEVPHPSHYLDAHPVSEEVKTAERVRQQANTGWDTEAPSLRTSDYEPNPSHQHVCATCGRPYHCWMETCTPQRETRTCPACEIHSARTAVSPTLPEAPCSINTIVTIQGRRCQITLRGHEEAEVLARLEAVLARYPLPVYQGE